MMDSLQQGRQADKTRTLARSFDRCQPVMTRCGIKSSAMIHATSSYDVSKMSSPYQMLRKFESAKKFHLSTKNVGHSTRTFLFLKPSFFGQNRDHTAESLFHSAHFDMQYVWVCHLCASPEKLQSCL